MVHSQQRLHLITQSPVSSKGQAQKTLNDFTRLSHKGCFLGEQGKGSNRLFSRHFRIFVWGNPEINTLCSVKSLSITITCTQSLAGLGSLKALTTVSCSAVSSEIAA